MQKYIEKLSLIEVSEALDMMPDAGMEDFAGNTIHTGMHLTRGHAVLIVSFGAEGGLLITSDQPAAEPGKPRWNSNVVQFRHPSKMKKLKTSI